MGKWIKRLGQKDTVLTTTEIPGGADCVAIRRRDMRPASLTDS